MVVASLLPSIGSVVNTGFGLRQQERQNEFNQNMIREQNEYNSPSATVNRMVAAGVPYKQAIRAVGGVPSIGEQKTAASAAPYTGPGPADGLSQFANTYFEMSQAASQKANTRLQNAQAEGLEIENNYKRQNLEDRHEESLATVRNLESVADLNDSIRDINQVELNIRQLARGNAEIDAEFYRTKAGLELQQIALDNALDAEQLLFDVYTFFDRADAINLSNEDMKSQTAEHYAVIRQVRQLINSNKPDEEKANNITKLRDKYPNVFKYLDAIDYFRPHLLEKILGSGAKILRR